MEISGVDAVLARDLAMHVTAHDPTPLVVNPEDLDPAVVDKEREIYQAQVRAQVESDAAAGKRPKPQEILGKMVDGRVRKFLAEVSLVEQKFVKDSSLKVGKLLGGQRCRVPRDSAVRGGRGQCGAEQGSE